MGGLFGGGKSNSTVAPKAAGLNFQTSAFGLVRPLLIGRHKVVGNLLDYLGFQAHAKTQTQTGGKGGGGVSSTTWTYTVVPFLGLCEGPVAADALKKCYTSKDEWPLASWGLLTGATPQAAAPYLLTYYPDHAIGYPGLTVVYGEQNLGGDASLPNWEFILVGREPYAGVTDALGPVGAEPYKIFQLIWTDLYAGLGQDANLLADLGDFADFCLANDWLLSLYLNAQEEANRTWQRLLEATNSDLAFYGQQFHLLPRGDAAITGNGVTWTPDLTSKYSFDTRHFLVEPNQLPVRWQGVSPADQYNRVMVEWCNKDNQYIPQADPYQDDANTKINGVKLDPTTYQYHEITRPGHGLQIAQLRVNRYLWQAGIYEFNLSWHFCRLVPGDLVDLSEPLLGLVAHLVRLTRRTTDADGCYIFEAEPVAVGTNTPKKYDSQTPLATPRDESVDPGDVNDPPKIFMPPTALMLSELEIWAAVSGGENWGGCFVWLSETGDNYQQAGEIIRGARYGVTTADLPAAGASPDTVDTLSVDLTVSRGSLASGTQQDADHLNTLCKVGDEYLAFKKATLTSQYKYDLTEYLVRGCFGSGMSLRLAGSDFIRLDQAIFKYPCTRADIGKTIYLKFQSFNVYGKGLQNLADLTEYSFTITNPGGAAAAPVVNLTAGNNAGAPETKMDVSFDACPVYDAEGSEYNLGGLGFTIDAGSVGLNGLDTGSLALDSRYYFYAVANPTQGQAGGLLSLSDTVPALPAGYTHRRLLGTVKTDGSSHLQEFSQTGNEVMFGGVELVATGSAAQAWTTQDCSGLMPAFSTTGWFSLQVTAGANVVVFGLRRPGSTTTLGQINGGAPAGGQGRADGWVNTDLTQETELNLDQDADWSLYLSGFILNL